MKIAKDRLLRSLPVQAGNLIIRSWTRDDMDRRAGWPAYPEPYAAFNGTVRQLSPHERDAYFGSRETDPNRLTLAIDTLTAKTIGHVVLKEIDWANGAIGNMGVRLHPDWCARGVGTAMMAAIVHWLTDRGVARITLDVAGSNARALRCYEKVGFARTEEFDRDGVPFTWMELRTQRPTTPSTGRRLRSAAEGPVRRKTE